VFRADAVTFNYPIAAYDLIVAYGLYHCLDDDAVQIVHEGAFSALKSGGLFAFAAFNDQLPVPDGHLTGEIFLRDSEHIFELIGDKFEIIEREVGVITEDHLPTVDKHSHSLTWTLLRKK
jgi:hypothetical protein